MRIKYFILCFFLVPGIGVFAQKAERKHLREGNKDYKKEKYTESEIEYRKALEVNGRSPEGTYNLGNSLYKQDKNKEAIEQYMSVAGIEKDKEKLSSAYHNMGNSFMKENDIQKGIEAYKQALRFNPHDNETRFNLALAQKMLNDQQQQDQDQKDDQEQENKEDQNKEEQQKDQQQDNKDQQNQDPEQQQKDQQQQNQEKQQQQQMSKENAEQLLNAIERDERDTQEKVKQQQMKMQQRRATDKDW